MALCADQAGADGKKPREIFEEIESRLRLLFGPGDDLGLDDLYKGLGLVYKNTLCLDSLADGAKLLQLAAVLRQKANPMVDSTGMGRRGFSLLGQRPVFDACVLQMLIAGDEWPAKYRTHVMTTPENLGPFTLARDDARGPLRGFPRGLDVFAAAGNPLARETLQAWGDDAYEGYPERLVAARNLWTERLTPTDSAPLPLYDDVLGVANGVVEAKAPPGAPDWMRSTEYQRLRLNSGLAVWAGLRHEAILYAKQSYTGILRALPPGRPEAGYVEPRPLLYGQMAEAAARVAKSLDGVAGGASQVAKNAAAVQRLMERLKTISDGLLAGRPLSDDDEKWISGFHLAMSEALRLEPDLAEQIGFDLSDPVSVVADVHTRAPLCVEEGVGDLWEMRVEVGHDETMRTVRGPIFAYYEFKQPMESRLTDEAWRALLASDNAPKPLLLKASEK
ncbi:MAG: DUF3160 domain-containing protein [Candidatus Sumerlaeota bacterium]|nr:DUF3160 domain-containing protein [Candidatus Sumerlaeota bacterium]